MDFSDPKGEILIEASGNSILGRELPRNKYAGHTVDMSDYRQTNDPSRLAYSEATRSELGRVGSQ